MSFTKIEIMTRKEESAIEPISPTKNNDKSLNNLFHFKVSVTDAVQLNQKQDCQINGQEQTHSIKITKKEQLNKILEKKSKNSEKSKKSKKISKTFQKRSIQLNSILSEKIETKSNCLKTENAIKLSDKSSYKINLKKNLISTFNNPFSMTSEHISSRQSLEEDSTKKNAIKANSDKNPDFFSQYYKLCLDFTHALPGYTFDIQALKKIIQVLFLGSNEEVNRFTFYQEHLIPVLLITNSRKFELTEVR